MNEQRKRKSQRKRRAEAREHAARHAVVRVDSKLVPRVIAADCGQQAPNNSYSPPQYYIDREFKAWIATRKKSGRRSDSSGGTRCRLSTKS